MIQLGHIEVSLPEEELFEAGEHDGTRFSGWNVSYEFEGAEWLEPAWSLIESETGLEGRYEKATWVNVLKGAGAHVEEHREGVEDTDYTVVLFLTDAIGGELVIGEEIIHPEPGKFVVFPSKELHRVEPIGDCVRITAATLYRRKNGTS